MKLVLIPIETSSRERLYKTYLSLVLASRGFDAYLGVKGLVSSMAGTAKNCLYLDKGFHPGHSEALFSTIASRGGAVVNLDEEGAVDFGNGQALASRYGEALFASSSRVFCWGERQAARVARLAKSRDQVVVTGHPRFQLLEAPFRTLYSEEAGAIEDRFGRFVLVNTNMGFGNNIRGASFVVERYESRYPFVRDLIALDQKKLAFVMESIRQLVNAGYRVVIRPHPEEDISAYRSSTAGLAGTTVCFEGSAVPWILASIAVVHVDCTTAIEAVMLGRRAVSVLPLQFESDLVAPLPLDVSHRVEAPSDVVDLVGSARIDEPLDALAEAVLHDYFTFGQDATGRIAAGMEDVASGLNDSEWPVLGRIAVWRQALGLARREHRGRDQLIGQKLDGFTFENVRNDARRLREIQPALRSVRLKRVAPQLFRFSAG